MKSKAFKRVVAVALSVFMAVGLMPQGLNVFASTVAPGVKSYDWSVAQILAASAGDRGLTLCGDGWSNNEATDDKSFSDGFSAVGDNAKAGGAKPKTAGANAAGTVPDEGCYIKYTATTDGTLDVYTKIGNNKTFYIVDEDGNVISKNNTSGVSTFDIVSSEVKTGKTYYAYLASGTAQVWKVSLRLPEIMTKSAIIWSSADVLAAVTTDNGLTLCGDGWSNNVATDDKSFEDGVSALGDNAKAGSTKPKTAGANAAGTVPDAGCFVKYTAVADGTLNIYTKIGNNKTFYIVGDDESVVSKKNTTGESTFDIVSVEAKSGVTYYAYLASGTAQIWRATFVGAKAELDAAALLAATSGKVNNGVTLRGDGWNNNQATDDKSFSDGFSAVGDNAKAGSAKPKTAGANAAGTIPDEGCFAEYTAYTNGTLDVYTKIGNNKTFYIVGSDGSQVSKSNTTDSSTFDIVSAKVKSGVTYYAYLSAGTAQIWKIAVKPFETVKQTPWADVAAPVLGTVTEDETGHLVVPVTATIDKLTGAEYVTVVMYQDGKQVEEKTIKKAEDVVFTPLTSGDFTFAASAVRTGEKFKNSNTVEFKDYVLAVKKPVVIYSQNRGDGKYYLDWIRVNDADSYKVSYKVAGSDDEYTTKDTTENSYELTGLAAGTYDVVISAVRSSDGYVAKYSTQITVNDDTSKQWYVATTGSAQQTNAVITSADGSEETISMSSQDTAAEKKNVKAVSDITNTTGKVSLAASTSGKISDGEEGFSYYYTFVDPNTENFKLTATFKVTDVSLTPDNQTGFGIMATDMLGINYYGTPDYYHKFYNETSAIFWYAKSPRACMRNVTGYINSDTSNNDDITRNMEEKKFDSDMTFEEGKEITFTLEKTNEKFIVTCGDQTQELNDTSILSVQEDGSICVGVMTSRKVGVEVSDIKFNVSESSGVTASQANNKITPNDKIYSTSTTGSKNYEFIHSANTDGKLVVKMDGETIFSKNVTANAVTRIPTALSAENTVFTTQFTPSGTLDTLTSTETRTNSVTVNYKKLGNDTLFVAADAADTGLGTYSDPVSLEMAVKYARPGQTIVLKNGTYTKGAYIARSVCGTEDNMITMIPETKGGVVLDGKGITLEGQYWHIYGFEIKNCKSGTGMTVSGNYNVVEMCVIHGSSNTGLQISRTQGAEREAGIYGLLWPTGNLIKNCESYDNCDAGRNDADGFAAKLTCGEDNTFYGCISHNNIDDGWDLFAKPISGEIGKVTIENCVAYNNGWLTTDDTTAEGYSFGEGNGFKLGGGYLNGGHKLINSVSFANGAKGITSNSCPDCEVYDSTSYNNSVIPGNSSYNVGLNKKADAITGWKVNGLISMANPDDTTVTDLIPFGLYSSTNYIYNGSESYNTEGVKAEDSWFESVDVSVLPTRNEDGTINMHGLLVLKDNAPADTGARLDTTSNKAKSVMPSYTIAVDEYTYTIIEGADQTVDEGAAKELTVKIDGDYDLFKNVEVDDVVLDATMYTVVKGSTVVTLSDEFMKTLSVGSHIMRVNFTNGKSVETTITVKAQDSSSTGEVSTPTGDASTPFVFILLMIMAAGAAVAVGVSKKKRA